MAEEISKILIVDDQPDNIDTIKDILGDGEYSLFSATNGKEALEIFKKVNPDLVLLDALMPVMDGFQVAREIKNNPETQLTPVIMITALDSMQDRVKGLEAGVDDFISRPFNIFELKARIKNLLRMKESLDELENAEQVIFSLAKTVEAKDKYTEGHCNRLADLAVAIGEYLNLPPADLKVLKRGGILHDIGKIAIRDSILLKPGKLTPEEFEVIKEHPKIGVQICSPLKTLKPVLPLILYHHERYNGSGYPEGLKGEEIPLLARIIGMVDCFDSLTTKRPYRRALSVDEALEICEKETKQGLWDPKLFAIFKNVINEPKLKQQFIEWYNPTSSGRTTT
ncbi:MAG: response regulator [Caldisericaceae bacterium]|nr:response regulator [Caldisericaceae bacterium]